LKDHRTTTSVEDQIKLRNKFHDFFAVCRRGLLKMMDYGRDLARQRAREHAQQQDDTAVKEKEKIDEMREVYVQQFNTLLVRLELNQYKISEIKESLENDEKSEDDDYDGGDV
jgi:SAM-dependent MidA family methyltransferase